MRYFLCGAPILPSGHHYFNCCFFLVLLPWRHHQRRIEIEKLVRFYLPRMASPETKFKTFVSINAIIWEKICFGITPPVKRGPASMFLFKAWPVRLALVKNALFLSAIAAFACTVKSLLSRGWYFCQVMMHDFGHVMQPMATSGATWRKQVGSDACGPCPCLRSCVKTWWTGGSVNSDL